MKDKGFSLFLFFLIDKRDGKTSTYFGALESNILGGIGPETKNGKPVSHRYNYLPLLASAPGGVQQELVVPICRRKHTCFLSTYQVAAQKIEGIKAKPG